jgi:hypothetical protein
MSDMMTHRIWHITTTRVAPLTWFASLVVCCGLALGDEPGGPPPMPPLPEDVKSSPVIQTVAIDPAAPLPLTGASVSEDAPSSGRRSPAGPLGNWSVLAAIGAAFAVLAAFRFQQGRRRARDLPPDVFDVLGEASLGGQHAVRVVRFGPRTLLVSVSSAGCQTLATLDDPQVTERIVTACLGGRSPKPVRGASRDRSPVREPPQPAGGGTG